MATNKEHVETLTKMLDEINSERSTLFVGQEPRNWRRIYENHLRKEFGHEIAADVWLKDLSKWCWRVFKFRPSRRGDSFGESAELKEAIRQCERIGTERAARISAVKAKAKAEVDKFLADL